MELAVFNHAAAGLFDQRQFDSGGAGNRGGAVAGVVAEVAQDRGARVVLSQ